ncbi:MAG: hypothetical protein IJY39_09030 [Clostridia bacterium]|nr:hypothetical protein [Clostridia bacterium]
MAVKSEYVTVGERTLIRHVSDSNKYIRQVETGILYRSATDVIPCKYTYEETEREIPKEEEVKEIDQ